MQIGNKDDNEHFGWHMLVYWLNQSGTKPSRSFVKNKQKKQILNIIFLNCKKNAEESSHSVK